MASSPTQICNQSLALLGGDLIADIEDADDGNALICKQHYEGFVKKLIALHTWRFATKKVALSGTTTPVNEWKYAYPLPTDLLAGPDAVFDSTAQGADPHTDWEKFGADLLTDRTVVVIDYRFRQIEGRWPVHFEQLMIDGFAARIAAAVTEDNQLALRLHVAAFGQPDEGMLGGYCRTARNLDSKQNIPDVIDSGGLIEARSGSAYPTQR